VVRYRGSSGFNRKQQAGGFTLIEILVALAIVGVATYIIISLFSSAFSLAQNNRARRVAGALAEGQLADLMRNPAKYAWPDLKAAKVGELSEVSVRGETDKGGRVFDAPSVMPIDKRAFNREQSFYGKFSWDAYVKLPKENVPHAELTVVVRWRSQGRSDAFALTSCVPRSVMEGAA
jgi:prepilin-type N-terminal cleavage/methylation domain-containing protein